MKNKRGFVSYFDNMTYTVWNEKSWHVFYQNNAQNCTHSINGDEKDAPITTMLPDFTDPNWKFLGQAKLKQLDVYHYRLYQSEG